MTNAADNGVPISQIHKDDVFVVGYPKSGNTWFQNLAAAVLYGLDPSCTPDALIQHLIPDVHYKRSYVRFMTPTVFKSHAMPDPAYRKVVYLIRDVRDVMVSCFHYLHALGHEDIHYEDLIEGRCRQLPCQWHEHVEAWQANPYNARMITIRYEDLQHDPLPQLHAFCELAGIERNDGRLLRAAESATFEKMRLQEQRFGYEGWPRDRRFVRRGAIGGFRDEMPAAALKKLMAQAGATLTKYAATPLQAGTS